MSKLLQFLSKRKNINQDSIRTLHPDDLFTNWTFIKQNILGGLSCFFVLLFSNVLKTLLEARYFNIWIQLQILILFVLSLGFFSLTLFFLKKRLLLGWSLGFIVSSLVLFIDKLPYQNIFFYIFLSASFLLFLFASYQYKKTNETFLKFNWKIIFQSGFVYQFFGLMMILISMIAFSYVKIDRQTIDGAKTGNIINNVIDYWAKSSPDSFLNKNFETAVDNFVTQNNFLSSFQAQYSVLGLSVSNVFADNIKNMFNTSFDVKANVSKILVDFFNQASQATKAIVTGLFLWFILSIIGFTLFFSKILVYYFSQLIIYALVWLGFLSLKERPATKEDLIL